MGGELIYAKRRAEGASVLPIIYIGLTVGLWQCELFILLCDDFNLQHRYILRGKRLLTLNKKAVSLLTAEHERHPDDPRPSSIPRPVSRFGSTNFTICTRSCRRC